MAGLKEFFYKKEHKQAHGLREGSAEALASRPGREGWGLGGEAWASALARQGSGCKPTFFFFNYYFFLLNQKKKHDKTERTGASSLGLGQNKK
jgi:hypothetical protein